MGNSVAAIGLSHRLHTAVGKTIAQGVIFVLVFHGWPLQTLSQQAWWQRTPLTPLHKKPENPLRSARLDSLLTSPAPEPAHADTGACPVCDGAAVVVNTAIELDAANLPGTAGVLAPFASFDGETITISLGARALQVTATGRISVLAGSTRHPVQFHHAGNHGTPNLIITSSCTLRIDESTRGTVNSKFRNLTGMIETNALGGRAGDIHLAFAGPITINGGVQSFQEDLPDAQASLSGALTIENTCGDLRIGPSAWLVTWGQNPGSGSIELLQTRGGDIVIDGVVMNRTNHTIGDNDPPIINVIARAGGATINGGHLVLDEWNLMGTKYDVTSGLVVISREAADVGRIAIQATGDVSIARDVSGMNLNRQNFAAVATVVNSSGPKGGEVQVRSLAGSIAVRDRAVQADGRGLNGAAVIELVADRDIVVESPTVGNEQHRPTLTTAAAAVNGAGQGGTNILQACDGVVIVAAGAEVLATGLSAPGLNQITADEVSLLGTVNPSPVLGLECDDPEPLFPEDLDQTPPTLSITSPSEPVIFNDETPEISVAYADDDFGIDLGSLHVLVDGAEITATCIVGATTATCEPSVLVAGPHTVAASIGDLAGNVAAASVSFTLLLNAECMPGTTQACYEGPPNTFNVGLCVEGLHTCRADGTFGLCVGQVLPQPEIPDNGIDDDCDGTDQQSEPPPPDPGTVAPPLDQTVSSTAFDATNFLYTGPDPIQTGVEPGTIEPQRVAVIRGQVSDRNGAPLPGVTVSVLHHPEYGQTLTRADGMFDLVVNGGGPLTLNYEKPGSLPAQRQVTVPWQDYTFTKDVVLISPDPQVTTVDLSSSTSMQVAQGSVVTDDNGSRQAAILFPQGTQAEIVLPDGSTQPLTTLHVRATEYTVGDTGPRAMPAQLPPSSAYTYAVELSADEATAAGATEVRFNQALPLYVDNFLGFPVGTAVPVGVYDRQQGVWTPTDNGIVLKILGISGGLAQLDANGDNTPESAATLSALGITFTEQMQLALMYPAGRSLWRIALTYFSAYDCNWPGGPPADAIAPNGSRPIIGDEVNLDDPDMIGGGNGIAYQNQTLGHRLEMMGTPFTLAYQSSRARGNHAAYVATIPLTGASLPPSVIRVQVTARIAGQQHTHTFAPQPNLSYTFTWDGKDGYGRQVQGRQPLEVSIEFVYGVVYQQSRADVQQAFGLLSGVPLPTPNPRGEVVTGVIWTGPLGAWDARAQGLGGWSLDAHHSYDPIGQALYLGNGFQRRNLNSNNGNVSAGLTRFAGGGSGPVVEGEPARDAVVNAVLGLAVGADGSVYLADTFGDRVRRVAPNGTITTVAGGGVIGVLNIGAGAPATTVLVDNPTDVALGPDGSLYIAAPLLNRVLRVRPDGLLTVFAGSGGNVYNGEGQLAATANLSDPEAVAVGPDGSVYISDTGQRRVWRVGPDSRLYTVAGTGTLGTDIDVPASQARVTAQDLAVGPDGLLYLATIGHVLRIDRDGILRRIAGNPNSTGGDGDPATSVKFAFIEGITIASNGVLFIADANGHRVRMVTPDGVLTTIAGVGISGLPTEGAPPTRALISFPNAVATGPDGSLYFSVGGAAPRVLRVRSVLPGFSAVGDVVIPARDGSGVYVFSPVGKHLRTVNPLTNTVIYTFGHDSAGRLSTVMDANNNITTIQRDANGNPTAIVGPYGQSNTLTLDANGYMASLTNAAGETTAFSYTTTGLLTEVMTPLGDSSSFTYDSQGRLLHGADPAGGSDTLTRATIPDGYQVTHTTAENRQSTYQVEFLATDEQRRVNTFPDGTQEQTLMGTDGSQATTLPDGMQQDVVQGPDPRFGMQTPLPTALTVTTPGGKTGTLTSSRTATLSDPTNPLSLTSQTDTATFNGRTATRTYNAVTRTFTDTSPAGRQRTTTLDTQGRVVQQQQGTLTPTQFSYDSRGRLSTRVQGGRSASLSYDAQGRLAALTDPALRTVQFQYDAAGRVTRQTLPDGREITYTYDATGNVTSITPPGQPAHVFTYTPVNLEHDYTAPPVNGGGTQQTLYAYNADRQLTQITRPDGQGVQLDYDAAGRLQTQTLPTGQISYTYAPTTGNLQTVTSTSTNTSTVTYTYDGSLLTSSTWAGTVAGNVSRTYDNNYRLTSQSVNGGNTISFTYDTDDLLTGAGTLTLSRDTQNGLLIGTTLGSVGDALTYNGFGELSAYQATVSGTSALTMQYTRDPLGRITQKTETIGGVTDTYVYSYDDAGRLTEVKQNGAVISTYTYDANSNRLNRTTSGGTVSSVYDAQDRLLSYGSATYTYTANGELQSKIVGSQTTTYIYDVVGNLLSVMLPDGTQIEYVIDGENRRIGKKVNGVFVQGFLYQDQLEPVAELDGSGTIVARFVYGSKAHVPDYLIKNGTTYRIISDHLGSPRLVIDTSTNTLTQRIDYDEFGNVILDTNPGFQPFGFAGGLYDQQTKLTRFGARDYDAETGRWTAKDPIRFRGLDTNLYEYVFNDPINTVDLTGQIDFSLGSLFSGFSIRSIFNNSAAHSVGTILLERVLDAIAARVCPGIVRDFIITIQYGLATVGTLQAFATAFLTTTGIVINAAAVDDAFLAAFSILVVKPGAVILGLDEVGQLQRIGSSKAITCERERS